MQRPAGPSPLGQWATVVVGADFRSSDGQPIPIFDNARRDVASALLSVGFSPERLVQLSVNPNGEPSVVETTPEAFTGLAQQATANAPGCLFYFSSHGNQQGIVFGRANAMLDPATLGGLINRWCGERPTVVMVSACYSGVFVPALSGPNRMVVTAARPDRTSFGCGGSNQYPYFDECVLQTLPQTADLAALAQALPGCIARKEQQTGASPPSEPQVFIGDQIRPLLASLPFVDGRGAARAQPPQPPLAPPRPQSYPEFQDYPQAIPYPEGDPAKALAPN